MSGKEQQIETIRKARGLTQEEVAQAIGVSRPSYIKIETGEKELTLSQAEALATTFHLSMEELFGSTTGVSPDANKEISVEKYKQIILNAVRYGSSTTDGKITKTKLAKLVYLADFIWFYEHSEPMSGMPYRKLPRGPVSDIYFRALDELEEEGLVVREPRGRAILFSLVESEAPTGKLSNDEVKMIKKISQAWREKSTDDIVNFTHEQMPWQICLDGEVIPYSLIFQEESEKIYGPAKV